MLRFKNLLNVDSAQFFFNNSSINSKMNFLKNFLYPVLINIFDKNVGLKIVKGDKK